MKNVIITISCLILSISAKAQVLIDSSYVPVRISTIEAVSNTNNNKLTWKTACFISYAKFDIQRSYDGINYSSIDGFTADQLRCQQPFDYSDYTANQLAGRVYYRLKVGDLDGRVYNSKIVAVFTNGQGIEINSFLPTIVTSSATMSISSSAADNAVINITNVQGVIVKTIPTKLSKGVNVVQIAAADLAAGKYWLTLRTSKEQIKTTQFIKQ